MRSGPGGVASSCGMARPVSDDGAPPPSPSPSPSPDFGAGARWAGAGRGRRGIALGVGAVAVVAVVLLAVQLVSGNRSHPSPRAAAGSTADPLSIVRKGAQLIDQGGEDVQLRGVNRSGTEYRCRQADDAGFITDDGTGGRRLADADGIGAELRRWTTADGQPVVNVVRIPLNEDCWLGINGVDPRFGGSRYQAFIAREVRAITRAGIYPIIDLHWSGPGTDRADQQDVAPNADHSVTLWSQVARTFKDNPAVMFDLFNEPRIDCGTAACRDYPTYVAQVWGCYRDGCTYTYRPEDAVAGRSGSFRVAGTQQLVDAIRATGARNVIQIEGLGHGNALDNWIRYRPKDPLDQLVAQIHTYPSSGRSATDSTKLDVDLAQGRLSTRYPIVVGEFAEATCPGAASTGFAERTMTWADQHGYGYLAWAWDAGQGTGCDRYALVTSDRTGRPTAAGLIVLAHLRTRFG